MPTKQGQLSRADILLALEKLHKDGADIGVESTLAQLLGFDYELVEEFLPVEEGITIGDLFKPDTIEKRDLETPKDYFKLNNPSPTVELKASYWQLLKQVNRELEEEKETPNQITSRPIWRGRPKQRPAFPALMSEEAIQQRLLPLLRQKKATRRVDIDKLIGQVSRAEFVTELPMQRRRRDTQALQIIDDRQTHLMPYWLDHSWLTWHIRDSMAEYRFSHAVIEQGESQPQSILQKGLTDYQAPPEASTILLLSDLGVLTGQLSRYTTLLEQLLTQGYHVVVVTPCHVDDYPTDVVAKVSLVSWEQDGCKLPAKQSASIVSETEKEQSETETSSSICPRQQWAESLLMLCSTAIRLEPELLRSIRYTLNDNLKRLGKQVIPVSAESLAWQHRAVAQKHSVAATIDTEENKRWQLQLKSQPAKLKRDVFDIQRQWRGGDKGLPDEIWFEEFIAIENCCDERDRGKLTWFTTDFDDTASFYQYLHQCVLSEGGISSLNVSQVKAWLSRVDGRLTDAALSSGGLNKQLQVCLQSLSDEKGQTPAGHVLDPALQSTGKRQQALKSAWLCQRGNQWVVTKHDPLHIPKNCSSLIARLDYRVCTLKVEGVPKAIELPKQLDDEFIPIQGTENLIPEQARLQTDLTELKLTDFHRPKWAKSVGRDAYGLFADLDLARKKANQKLPRELLVQRFRWIPASTFMMGSPDNEPERYGEYEDYHQITLTKGYWLADTTVTQAVWQAVMGENPMKFMGGLSHPAEQISWDDSQNFIQKINEELITEQGNVVCRLPTEAEWEHACRAGTTTPFSFGETMISEQVNFDGTSPYNNGPKSEERGKTVAVKSLLPNQWGLYEMHGNVEEWCADAWQDKLGRQPMLDSYHRGDSGAHRVMRGGSWINRGGYVRSAYRRRNSRDSRGNFIGLRLSLGHELGFGKTSFVTDFDLRSQRESEVIATVNSLLDTAIINQEDKTVTFITADHKGRPMETTFESGEELVSHLSTIVDDEYSASVNKFDGEYDFSWNPLDIAQSALHEHSSQLLSFFYD